MFINRGSQLRQDASMFDVVTDGRLMLLLQRDKEPLLPTIV
ncbi:MAG: hypothetical protein NQ127_00410 [Candidatus Cardinium sp.]|nr:hypothetical protein [Candidatus Cardinium sp.]